MVAQTDNEAPVVALLGISTFPYFISMLGLSRLGYALLILSPRLSTEAFVRLLEKTNCQTVVHMTQYLSAVEKIREHRNIESYFILERSNFDGVHNVTTGRLNLDLNREVAGQRIAYIMHSSGSTGLPKPIFQTHQACLENFENGNGLKGFSTAPLYHTFGFASVFRTMSKRGILYMYDHTLPLTSRHLLEAMEVVNPEVFFGVPYALKLLAESEKGIETLAACESVIVSGSACPDNLGNQLVERGVHLIATFGATECGQLATSRRPRDDKNWNYLRFYPNVKPYVYMKSVSTGLYELVILDGLKSKVVSNSDDPPKSFYSRDLFTPHPSIEGAWKHTGRLDDRVTLVNGEKVLPVPIESRIREHAMVAEAVVFGIGRDAPGLLAFKSEDARDLSDNEFVETIWPVVQDANSRAEGFSQISKDSIVPIAAGTPYPQTDKGTIIRAQVYKVFEREIETMYNRLQGHMAGSERLDLKCLEHVLLHMCGQETGLEVRDVESDLFAAGMDSLKAAQFSSAIRKRFYLGRKSQDFSSNTIYECAAVGTLAKHIHALQNEEEKAQDMDLEFVPRLIEEYSAFEKFAPGARTSTSPQSGGCAVVLTGATGSLGCHILKVLVEEPSIDRIFCLVRVPRGDKDSQGKWASERILESLREREMIPRLASMLSDKIISLATDLSTPGLGLSEECYSELLASTTAVVHAAWPVNFKLSFASFRPQLVALHNLLQLSLSVHRAVPAKFIFCSSVSTATASFVPATIPEAALPDPKQAQPTGYARSKFCAEHIVHNAVLHGGADAAVLRIGQIIGDNEKGFWNPSEAVPLMVRSAEVLGVLPELEGEACRWLPVDECARVLCEIGGLVDVCQQSKVGETTTGASFYNILHPRPFCWSGDFLPAIRASGIRFDTVPTQEWLTRLSRSDPDPLKNPSVKLLDFWSRKYGNKNNERSADAGTGKDLVFITHNAQQASRTLKTSRNAVESGLVERIAARWLREWRKK